jgi:hypothetical protein
MLTPLYNILSHFNSSPILKNRPLFNPKFIIPSPTKFSIWTFFNRLPRQYALRATILSSRPAHYCNKIRLQVQNLSSSLCNNLSFSYIFLPHSQFLIFPLVLFLSNVCNFFLPQSKILSNINVKQLEEKLIFSSNLILLISGPSH